MKNLIVGVAAAAVLAAGALVFTSVKVSAKIQPDLDVYDGCTGPVVPAYTVDRRMVGVCANRSIYQCFSAYCDKFVEPTYKPDPRIVDKERYPGDVVDAGIDDPSTGKVN